MRLSVLTLADSIARVDIHQLPGEGFYVEKW